MELMLIELAKLGLQAAFTFMAQANLTAEQEAKLVDEERARFLKNRSTPLPEV